MLKAKAPAAVATLPPVAPSPPPNRELGARTKAEELIPMDWPADAATCAGNQLAVMIDEEGRGWLGVDTPGRFLYLLGPLRSIHLPF